MDYFRNIVMLAAIAGAIAGLGMTVAQSFTTVPLILKAETFEGQGEAEAPAAAHEHATEIPAHSHGDEEGWAPEDGFERTAFTAAANIVTGIGFALLLIAVSELFGGIRDWRQGVYWGLAAFAVFTLAPGLGLPPELPAMPVADLGARQVWWIGTVVAAGVALWLLFYQRSLLGLLAAFALLVVPHIIGAPQPDSHESPIPESLHHSFVVAVVLTTLVYFALLGGLAGYFRDRFIRAS
ncbi:CbtA family protein [Methyloceanibacter sp.]|uniref:CbtA family protein n=1 Tax=Methyloceanibacter sp. TaxID=1965321 RepID=UPI00351B1403